MGCTKSISSEQGRLPSMPFLKKFQQILDLQNPLNINKKYAHLMKIIHNQTTGQTIFKTSSYNCLTTKEELQKKINQFWQTRTMGDAKSWESMRQAIKTKDQYLTRKILKKAGLVMVNQSMQMAIDQKLMRYQPLNYSKVDLAHSNLSRFKPADVLISIRNPNRGDSEIETSNTILIIQLKELYLKKLQQSDSLKVRLFFRGKQLQNDCSLGHYKIQSQDVIQSLLV